MEKLLTAVTPTPGPVVTSDHKMPPRSGTRRSLAAYDVAFKLKVLQHAQESGSNRATADHYGISEKQVHYWKKQKEQLLCASKSAKRMSGAGRLVKDKAMDEGLISWIKEQRKDGIAVDDAMVRRQAK